MQTLRLNYHKILVILVKLVLSSIWITKQISFFVNNFQIQRNVQNIFAIPFVKRRSSRNIQILAYHKVNDEGDPFFPATPIDVFTRQMELLSSQFNVCTLEDIAERMRKNDVPDNAIVVTFDDGYRDIYLNAFPILKRFSIPATIFLATDVVGNHRVLWHDRVFSAFRETKEPFLRKYGLPPKIYSLRNMKEKIFAQLKVIHFLRSLDEDKRHFWIDQLIESLKVEDMREAQDSILNWDEIKIMHRNGIDFGSHTLTHPILSQMPVDKVAYEICRSKVLIEDKLNTSIRTFAYPSGRQQDFNEPVKSILKDAGYICAVSMIFGVNSINQDLFELRRITAWDKDMHMFFMRLYYYKFCFNDH